MATRRHPKLYDEKWLRWAYEQERMTCPQVAEVVECSTELVRQRLVHYGIPRRGRWENSGYAPKPCAGPCGEVFKPKASGQRYCSTTCRAGTKRCEREGCSVEFAPTSPNRPKGTVYLRRFCSSECRNLWFRARARQTRKIDGQGYVRVTLADGSRVLEHRHVMAEHLGRPLTDDETVHHLDGDKANNALGNLQLRQGRHGKGARFVCRSCGSHDVEAVEL